MAALLVALAFGIGYTLAGGRTFHWDAVNYHFYLGFAALNDRFALDFFAAGTPAYINPYAYVPLYAMNVAGVPGWIIAAMLAAVHSLILWLAFELALAMVPSDAGRARYAFAAVAMVLAAMGPVLLQGLGLTLVDIPIGVFVVAGWLALAHALRTQRIALVVLGAALGGFAAGLKLSNALFAAAALSMVCFFPGGASRKLKAALAYCLGCGIAFAAISAPWSWKLWTTFGNPLFPFLNDVFASPDFTSATLYYERFRPDSIASLLARPFDMASPLSRQHTEGHAPDLRFAALFMALLAYAALAVWRASRTSDPRTAGTAEEAATSRILAAVAVAFVLAWSLWLKASGNSRYFIPVACIAAALLAALLYRAWSRWRTGAVVATLTLMLAQAAVLVIGADLKRDGLPWQGPLLHTQFSERFRDEPHLFLSTSFLSPSALLPYWHPDSGMITISGFYALGPGRPGWDRAKSMIAAREDRLRIISALPKEFDESTGLPGPASDLDVHVRRFGLKVDPSDCEFVKLQSNIHGVPKASDRERWTTWVTCRLAKDPEAAQRYLREVAEVDVVFDRVEASCPKLFHPPRPVTEQHPRWTRLYNMGSEMQLWIEAGRVLYFSPLLGGDPIDIGTVEAWTRAPQPIDCTRRFSPAFGIPLS